MKRTSLVLILTVLAAVQFARPTLLTAQASRQNPEALKLWKEGRELFDTRQFPEAEKKLREGLSKYPRSEWADVTSYHLIITLERLKRLTEARTEIENFLRKYPDSKWSDDVNDKRVALGGKEALAEQAAKTANERSLPLKAEVLRGLIQRSPAQGFEKVREYLSKNPNDPVVVSNIPTLYVSHSPQALTLLLDLSINPAASPKTRQTAVYWVGQIPDKTQVAEVLMEKLTKAENEPVVSDALLHMKPSEHRAVLERIAKSPNPNRFSAVEKIYRGGSPILRRDLVTIVATVQDPRATEFIRSVAQNEKDPAVRQAAAEALKTPPRRSQ